MSLSVHIFIATLVALIGSMLMLNLAYLSLLNMGVAVAPTGPLDSFESNINPLNRLLVGALFTPILETLAIFWIAEILLANRFQVFYILIIISTCAGLIHFAVAPFWAFGVFWSFFVFSSCYIVWRERSKSTGFVAALVPHSIINLISYANSLLAN